MEKRLNISALTSISLIFLLIANMNFVFGQNGSGEKLFRIKDKKTSKYLPNIKLTVEIPTTPKTIKSFQTDSDGFCFIKIGDSLSLGNVKILTVEGYNIIGQVGDRGEVFVEKEIILRKVGSGGRLTFSSTRIEKLSKKDTTITKEKIEAFKLEKEKLIKQKDSLNKEIEQLKEQNKISKEDIARLDKKIREFEKSTLHFLNRFRQEVLAKFDLDDSTSTNNLSLGNPEANKIVFDKYLNDFKKAYAEQKRLERNNRYLVISVIIGLLSIIGLLLWIRYKNKKYTRTLQGKKSLLEQQKATLAEQVAQLSSQEYLIKLLLSEAKHRVGNDLTSIQFKISSVSRKIKNDKMKALLQEVREHIKKLISIQKSLDYSFSSDEQMGQIPEEEISLKLTNIATTLFNFHFDNADHPEIVVSISVNNLIKSRYALISFCAFELINNACKYALIKGNENPQRLMIDLVQEKGYTKLVIENTGIGIDQELFENGEFLFDKLRISKGLKIVKKITEVEKGDIKVFTVGIHPEIKEGSRFECTFKC